MKRAAVFFDRDNTLIANDGYLGDPGGVVLVDGAADAIARVRGMGFSVVTFSNQSGVARGLFTEEAVHAVNARLDELLQEEDRSAVIARHEFCPYHPDGTVEKYRQDSDLRKPSPGMLLQAAERLDLDLKRSWVIGDAPRDIQAGMAVGCRTILFSDPKLAASSATTEASSATPEFVVASLKAAVDIIVNETLGPLDVYVPPVVAHPVETPVEPQPAATDVAPPEPSAANPQEAVISEPTPAEPIASPPLKKTVVDVATKAKSPTQKSGRSSPKITFAERVKSGAFVPAGKNTNATAEAPGEAVAQSQKAAERSSKLAAAVKGATGPRVRKPTFAERVRSGTFVPAGNDAASITPAETKAEPDVAAPALAVEAVAEVPVEVPEPLIETPVESPAIEPSSTESSDIAPAPTIAPAIQSLPATETSTAELTVESPVDTPAPPVEAIVDSVTETSLVEAIAEPATDTSSPSIEATIEVVAAPPTETIAETSAPAVDAAIEPQAVVPPPVVEAAIETPATVETPRETMIESTSDASAPSAETPSEHSEAAPAPSFDAVIESPPVTSEPAVEPPKEIPTVAAALLPDATATEIPMKTPTPNIAPPPEEPASAAPPKKMTFAERVKAGTFQAERAAAAGAASAPERPRRVMPMPGDKPQTQVNRVVESLTAVRPTEPVTPEEQLEPILQSILEELRQAREARPESDFSLVKLLTGIVQVLVLPALFFAYLNRGVPGDLQSMLMLATFLQTLVIALLIMGRS